MREVITGARLHFGLFQPGPSEPGQRRFGGAGMMIGSPGFHLRMTPSAEWTAEGPMAGRALAFARRCLDQWERDGSLTVPPHRFSILRALPEHAGLGSGTQLAMAVARLLSSAAGVTELSADLTGRGRRSGLGVHGFEFGGFLVDGGRREEGPPAPLIARMEVPDEWRIVTVLPPAGCVWHGPSEQSAFERLNVSPHTDRLCRLALLGMLPALAEKDCDRFGEALHEFNILAGEAFAPAQGGSYAGPEVAEAAGLLRSLGVKGVGQSSWGPLVFGVVADADRASVIARQVIEKSGFAECAVAVADPLNRGAVLL